MFMRENIIKLILSGLVFFLIIMGLYLEWPYSCSSQDNYIFNEDKMS